MSLVIQTSRLRLRTPTVGDLPAYLAYRNDPATLRSMGLEVTNEARALSFLRKQSELEAGAWGWRMLGVERLERPGLIGEVGVFLLEGDPTTGDLGWWLHPEHRGKGYAAEAVQALVRWCFDERGLQRVTAACLADNAASRMVMERVGMRLEGQSTSSRRVGERLLDECGYALSRTDWVAQA